MNTLPVRRWVLARVSSAARRTAAKLTAWSFALWRIEFDMATEAAELEELRWCPKGCGPGLHKTNTDSA